MSQAHAIAILGAGSWGTALAVHLAYHGQEIHLWDINTERALEMQQKRYNQYYLPNIKLPDSVTVDYDLARVLTNTHDVICAVPSHAFRQTLVQCQQHHSPQRIAWVSKGVDRQSCHLLGDIVKEIFGNIPSAILSGPSFASEVSKGLPTAVAIGIDHEHQGFASDLIKWFNHDHFRVYLCHDIVGVQLGGALKNIYAIAAGISDGLGFGCNARCALITRSLAEMSRLGTAMGAQQQTFMGLAGVGDLILTCTDDQSRNRRFGLALGQGNSTQQAEAKISQVIEGKEMASHACQLAKTFNVDMPVAKQVNACIEGKMTPKQAFNQLFARETKSEF